MQNLPPFGEEGHDDNPYFDLKRESRATLNRIEQSIPFGARCARRRAHAF